MFMFLYAFLQMFEIHGRICFQGFFMKGSILYKISRNSFSLTV